MSVPLPDQYAMYMDRAEAVLLDLRERLKDECYRRYIIELGANRLLDGYELYEDEMYKWSCQLRQVNMDEQLSDYTVFGTSEP